MNDTRFQDELEKMSPFVRFYPTKRCAEQNHVRITGLHFISRGRLNYMDDGESTPVSSIINESSGGNNARWLNHLTFISINGITSFKGHMLLTYPDLNMT